ncbi:alpha/beta hydrolase [Actinomadura meridiana]|uniref:alpha/beta fold hydrolase n=1 Tax=Actinomadura meridiana TaxID=559626 RepID=UPI0031EA09B6
MSTSVRSNCELGTVGKGRQCCYCTVIPGRTPPSTRSRHCLRTSSPWHARTCGKSSKPRTDADHTPYSKRAMASDMVNLMRELGHDEFAVAGHDRGALVAFRTAMDHPEAVSALIPMDGLPVIEHLERVQGRPGRPVRRSLRIWRNWADDVRGHRIDSGHHMAEEAPEPVCPPLSAPSSPRSAPSAQRATWGTPMVE